MASDCASGSPELFVVIDTEEEFDWSAPFSPDHRSVKSIELQQEAQDLLNDYGIRPTYVIDYPVAESNTAVEILRGYYKADQCLIGSHLHPWVNPPYGEMVNNRNSYPGNLPEDVERKKLSELTALIEKKFEFTPKIYKAGRYGIGPSTPQILKELGYQIDLSIVPYTDYSPQDGPDFSSFNHHPSWIGQIGEILEIPLTCGFVGYGANLGPMIYPLISPPSLKWLRLQGLAARLNLLERSTLTPEGVELAEMKRLTRSMHNSGTSLFCMNYHSSTLMPGGSPYVRSTLDRANFIEKIARFLDFFFSEMNGRATTPNHIRDRAIHGYHA